MQLREIDRDPHPHDLAAVAQSLQVHKHWQNLHLYSLLFIIDVWKAKQ